MTKTFSCCKECLCILEAGGLSSKLLLAGKQIIYLELIYLGEAVASPDLPWIRTRSRGRASVPSGLGRLAPGIWGTLPPSPACGLGSSASSPPAMTFPLSFPNYLLLFIWNLNIWEALRDQICRGHSLHSNFLCARRMASKHVDSGIY